jgi:glutamate decarboxylase
VKALIIPFIRDADESAPSKATGHLVPNAQGVTRNVLVESRKPEELARQLSLSLPKGEGLGEEGLLQTIRGVLEHSVNTWDQGFLDKLYASTNAVGLNPALMF